MRYIVTTYPVMFGGSNMAKGHYAPSHVTGYGGILGYANNVPVPNPGRALPKPGTWRLTPRSKHKAFRFGKAAKARTGPYLPANVQGQATALTCGHGSARRRMPRAEIRMLVACGTLPPSAMPRRGGKRHA